MSIDVEEIKVLIPRVPEAEKILPYLKRIDENRIYSNFGPLNSELIRRLSTYTGINSEYIATCANATLAIQGLMQTCPLQSEIWELPAWTFTATAAAAVQSGRKLRFVDASSDWRARFDRTSTKQNGLIDVAPFGDSIESEPVEKCKSLIIDAAPCFDSLKNFSLHEKYPIVIVVSLHATKLLPAGEGSFVLSNSKEWISKFKSWTNFGMNKDRVSLFIGTNAKLSELSAAVALASLDDWSNTRDKYVELTSRALSISHQYGFLTSPAMEKGLITPYWILLLNTIAQKKILIDSLNVNNIGWRDWWKHGIHKMPAYSHLATGSFPVADKISSLTLGLPFHTRLKDEDFLRIARSIGALMNQ